MNAKKIFWLTMALVFLAGTALGAVSGVEAWILKYNECAQKTSAPALDESMLTGRDERGFYEFAFSDGAYLSVYLNEAGEPFGFLFEAPVGAENAKSVFASSLAASDEAISTESAMDLFDLASGIYQPVSDGHYAYLEFDGWILIFSKGYGDGAYELFSAFTEEAYIRMYGAGPIQEIAPGNENPDSDENGDATPGEPKNEEPKQEETKVEDKIHKL